MTSSSFAFLVFNDQLMQAVSKTARAISPSRWICLEQWINGDRSGKPVSGAFAGWLCANSFYLHVRLPRLRGLGRAEASE